MSIKQKLSKVSLGRYGIDKLVYYEVFEGPDNAIRREKLLKDWNRAWKIRLIEEGNPDWLDLYPGLLG